MKKIFVSLIGVLCICLTVVTAQNTYGLSEETVAFLNEFNIDLDIFAEIFNGEDNEGALESLEWNLWSIMAQTRAYGFNEKQVKALVNSDVERILGYRRVEFVTIPAFKVTFNGQEVDSSARRYPILQFRDITYFPMTYDDCRFLGVTTHWDSDAEKLTIKKESVENAQYNAYSYFSNPDKFIYEGVKGIPGDVKNYKFQLEVNGKEIINENEEYPLLLFRNITYFPLTWRFAVDEFGWEYSYTEEDGLVINSKK